MAKRTVLGEDGIAGQAKYKKIGGGTFRTKSGKIIKPNQTFWAKPEDIPDAFKDTIKEVITGEQKSAIIPDDITVAAGIVESYEVIPGAGAGWFDVIDSTGKKMNEKGLRAEAANNLVTELHQNK